jgi:hypothetical protein
MTRRVALWIPAFAGMTRSRETHSAASFFVVCRFSQ